MLFSFDSSELFPLYDVAQLLCLDIILKLISKPDRYYNTI